MTLTVLVSFSLLALVVTARPILPRDGPQLVRPADVQNALQAVFQSRTGNAPDCLDCDEEDVHVHLTSSEEQDGVLSHLDGLDAVKTVVPLGLDGVFTAEERKLYDLLSQGQKGSLNDLEGGERPLPAEELLSDVESEAASPESELGALQEPVDAPPLDGAISPPLLILAFSGLAALLALGCITAALYASRFVTKLLASQMAWDILPRVESQALPEPQAGARPEKRRLPEFIELRVKEKVPEEAAQPGVPEATLVDTRDVVVDEKEALILETVGAVPVEGTHELELRAPSLLFQIEPPSPAPPTRARSPRIAPCADAHADPDLLPLPHLSVSTPFLTPDRSPRLAPLPSSAASTPFATPERTPLPLPLSTPFVTPDPSPIRSPLPMREVAPPAPSLSNPYLSPAPSPALLARAASPLSRAASPLLRSASPKPAWSLRATDAPSFALAPTSVPLPFSRAPPDPPSPTLPGGLALEPEVAVVPAAERPARRRAYRAAVPELDIAFALQLRPGLGLGADPAWLVRFMMAMFGWMTVLIGGTGAGAQERAIEL